MRGVKALQRYARIGHAHHGWYAGAREAIGRLCEREGWEYHRFVNILALTSPRVSVLRNYRFTEHYMRTGYFLPDMMRTIRASVQHYEQTGEIRGPKTSAFARNLLGDETALVLDVWMSRALGVEQKKLPNKPVAAAAFRRVAFVAAANGWSIAEAQAAIWAGVCMDSGVRPGSFEAAIQVSSQISLEF